MLESPRNVFVLKCLICHVFGFQQLGGSGPGGASNPAGKMEEDFTVARICVNKLKSEIKNLTSQNSTLEQARTEARDRLTESDDSLGKARLQVQQVRPTYECNSLNLR